MDPSTFLIVGVHGQLGTALKKQYPNAHTVDSATLDISNPEAVKSYDWSNITTILNAAAYTNVDGAETPEGRRAAWGVNATGARNLAEVAIAHNLTLVHISSDYVFDGTIENHAETELFTPLSVYGQSKAAGDIAVSLVPQHYILRTSWVIGSGKNFVRTMIDLAKRDISPSVVSDQIGRLTFTTTLTEAIDHLLGNGSDFGTYNVSNDGRPSSWADITRQIFAMIGRTDLSVTDVTTAEYFKNKPGIAPRPLNSCLLLDKLQATGFLSRNWQDDLRDHIAKEPDQQ